MSMEKLTRYETALRAIEARIRGEWDNPWLMLCGPFTTNTLDDVKLIAQTALMDAASAED